MSTQKTMTTQEEHKIKLQQTLIIINAKCNRCKSNNPISMGGLCEECNDYFDNYAPKGCNKCHSQYDDDYMDDICPYCDGNDIYEMPNDFWGEDNSYFSVENKYQRELDIEDALRRQDD
jgi:hypothetical protein